MDSILSRKLWTSHCKVIGASVTQKVNTLKLFNPSRTTGTLALFSGLVLPRILSSNPYLWSPEQILVVLPGHEFSAWRTHKDEQMFPVVIIKCVGCSGLGTKSHRQVPKHSNQRNCSQVSTHQLFSLNPLQSSPLAHEILSPFTNDWWSVYLAQHALEIDNEANSHRPWLCGAPSLGRGDTVWGQERGPGREKAESGEAEVECDSLGNLAPTWMLKEHSPPMADLP